MLSLFCGLTFILLNEFGVVCCNDEYVNEAACQLRISGAGSMIKARYNIPTRTLLLLCLIFNISFFFLKSRFPFPLVFH